MKRKPMMLLALSIFLLAVFNPLAYGEERKALSRNYVGLGVNVYAPLHCYPGEDIRIKVMIEALEDVKNASVTLFFWGSKSQGSTPWSTSITILDVTDFPTGTIKEETYNVSIPLDIDPSLAYGILYLDWSIYRTPSWEPQWDKASFRATYVKNRDYENLQNKYNQLEIKLLNFRITAYLFLATTIVLAVSIIYLAKKQK